MKRIITLSLAALMLVALLLTATSCGMESMTGYTRLRDHIKAAGAADPVVTLDAKSVGLTSASLAVGTDEEGKEYVALVGYTANATSGIVYQVTLNLTGSPEKAELVFEVLQSSTAKRIAMGTATVLLTHYTGDEFVTFTDTEGIAPSGEFVQRQNATILLNAILTATDVYTTDKMDMNVRELGFIALSDKYMADVDETVTEEDLGGAFSPERLSMAGLMIVQGMGMVFLVLAILWLVLLVFKKVFYKDTAKTEKKTEKTADAAPSAVAVPAPADDGQLVAAITAAVAAYIESDPALSSQFAGGFRVVSFKKKNGKTSWNH